MKNPFNDWTVYDYAQLVLGLGGIISWTRRPEERMIMMTLLIVTFIMLEAMKWHGFGPVMFFNWFYIVAGQLLMILIIVIFSFADQVKIGTWTPIQVYFMLTLVSAVVGVIMLFVGSNLGASAGLAGASALLTLPLVWFTKFPEGLSELTMPMFLVMVLTILCSAFNWKKRLPTKSESR